MELIKLWLAGSRDYTTGVKLYLQYGHDALLKKLFGTEQETPFKRQRLADELHLLVQDKAPSPGTIDAVGTTDGAAIIKSWPAQVVSDDVEQALRESWLLKYKEMQHLHSLLLTYTTDEERCIAAFKILRLDMECDILLQQRDYYREHHELPLNLEKENQYVQDPLLMGIRIASLQRYIRREGNKLRADPADVKVAARRQEFINELNYYLARLGKPLFKETILKSTVDETDQAGQAAQ